MRLPALSLVTALTLLGAVGCMQDAVVTGDLIIVTRSFGTPDPDGFELHVATRDSVAMADNDTARFNGMQIGDYVVKLTGLYVACSVIGGDSQLVYVPVGVRKVELDVTCP
jgi:hypothetical protein